MAAELYVTLAVSHLRTHVGSIPLARCMNDVISIFRTLHHFKLTNDFSCIEIVNGIMFHNRQLRHNFKISLLYEVCIETS